MDEILYERIPASPCLGCVPPERNADCHAKCERYLAWESHKNRINQAKREYRESVNYTSESMMKSIKKLQLRKGPRIQRWKDL